MKEDVLLWFNFIRGLNCISPCFKLKLIIIHFHPSKREIKFKPTIKLNHNIDSKEIHRCIDKEVSTGRKCTDLDLSSC